MSSTFTKGSRQTPEHSNITVAPIPAPHRPEPMPPALPDAVKSGFQPKGKDGSESPAKSTEQAARPIDSGPKAHSPPLPLVDGPARHAMIARAAYFAAERRGFKGGSAQDDWVIAEVQVDEQLGLNPAP